MRDKLTSCPHCGYGPADSMELDAGQQDSAQVAALVASQVHPESALPSRPRKTQSAPVDDQRQSDKAAIANAGFLRAIRMDRETMWKIYGIVKGAGHYELAAMISDAISTEVDAFLTQPTPDRATATSMAGYTDDAAVDRFAAVMKGKMAASRAKGRGGWEDPTLCSAADLRRMLVEHVSKGDPVDVGNFAMMLFNRQERTELLVSDDELDAMFAAQDDRAAAKGAAGQEGGA